MLRNQLSIWSDLRQSHSFYFETLQVKLLTLEAQTISHCYVDAQNKNFTTVITTVKLGEVTHFL